MDVKPIELKSVIQMVDVLNGLKIFAAVKGVSVISGPLLYLKKNNPFYPEEGIYKMANLAANLSKHSFINSLNIVVEIVQNKWRIVVQAGSDLINQLLIRNFNTSQV